MRQCYPRVRFLLRWTERPGHLLLDARLAAMDALSEVLRVITLDSAVFFNAELSEPCCLAVPDSRLLAQILVRGEGHVIVHHLLAEGRAYGQFETGERVTPSAGVVMRTSR